MCVLFGQINEEFNIVFEIIMTLNQEFGTLIY